MGFGNHLIRVAVVCIVLLVVKVLVLYQIVEVFEFDGRLLHAIV